MIRFLTENHEKMSCLGGTRTIYNICRRINDMQSVSSDKNQGKMMRPAFYAGVALVRALCALKMQQKEALQVHAGIAGVLEEVTVDAGQQVAPGTNLSKIRSSARLMARLHVPESQSRDLQLNQKAQIELQDRPYSGHVARIDPGVQNGAVDVDVKVDGAQPAGARTDLTVDGTIEVERVADAVYLGKALSAKPNTRVPLFKLVEDGNEAQRVMVELGNTSIDSVEIVAGLR